MLTLFRPRLRSWEDSVAVATLSSFAFSSAVKTCPTAAASAGARTGGFP